MPGFDGFKIPSVLNCSSDVPAAAYLVVSGLSLEEQVKTLYTVAGYFVLKKCMELSLNRNTELERWSLCNRQTGRWFVWCHRSRNRA